MVNTYTYKNVTWVDMESPTRDEIREVMKKYNIHPTAAEELILPSPRSKVDTYPDFIYLVLHFPAWKLSHQKSTQEIDFVICKNYIITTRYETVDPLHKFAKMFEVNSILDRNALIGEHAGYMFYYMMRELYRSLEDELETVKDALEEIEKKTFTGQEREMVYEISKAARELLDFKHATSLHEDVLETFSSLSKDFFGPEFARYSGTIKSDFLKVHKGVQGVSESLHEIRETNDALLEAKQNKNIMTLTVITFITAILGIIVGLFAADFKHAPIVGMPYDFWVLAGILVAIGVFFTAVFYHKKWL